jgi:hypothetical protein
MDLKDIIQKAFYGDKWNIGYANQSISDLVSTKMLNEIIWLTEEDSGFSADPFVLVVDDAVHIYYEFMTFWHGRGRIFKIDNWDFATKKQINGITPSKIHLSYPYIFADDNRIYCIPETSEANEIGLYDVQPGDRSQLKKRKVLLSGAPYLDSSIIKFNNKYWLFTSRKDRADQFFIFFAGSLSEEFLPHHLNPICCHPQFTRGAGQLFIDKGLLYRPTQNSRFGYGGSIIISKITELTENTFDSEVLMELLPDKFYKDGLHNISFEANLIVIDGKRKIYSPYMPLKKLIREFKTFQAKLSNLDNR